MIFLWFSVCSVSRTECFTPIFFPLCGFLLNSQSCDFYYLNDSGKFDRLVCILLHFSCSILYAHVGLTLTQGTLTKSRPSALLFKIDRIWKACMQVQDFYYFLVLHYNMAFTSKCQLLELFNYAEQFSFPTAIAGCAYDRVRRSGVAIKNSNCDSFGNKKKHLSCSFIASTLSLNAW